MYSKSKYAGLPEFVDYLHKNGLHYIPIIDPAISSSEKLGTYKPYEIGLEMNVFIQNVSGDPFEGRVWTNGKCVWPDFTNPKVIVLFSSLLTSVPLKKIVKSKFYKKRGATFFYDITRKLGPLDFTQYRSKSSSF